MTAPSGFHQAAAQHGAGVDRLRRRNRADFQTIRLPWRQLSAHPLAAGRPSHPCHGALHRWWRLFIGGGPSSTWMQWPMPRRSPVGVHATANTRRSLCHTNHVCGACRPTAPVGHAAEARFDWNATAKTSHADAPRYSGVAHAAASRFGRHAPASGAAVVHATHFAPLAGISFRGACRGRAVAGAGAGCGQGQVGPPRAIPAANMPFQSDPPESGRFCGVCGLPSLAHLGYHRINPSAGS
jgi:hypothetical protein